LNCLSFLLSLHHFCMALYNFVCLCWYLLPYSFIFSFFLFLLVLFSKSQLTLLMHSISLSLIDSWLFIDSVDNFFDRGINVLTWLVVCCFRRIYSDNYIYISNPFFLLIIIIHGSVIGMRYVVNSCLIIFSKFVSFFLGFQVCAWIIIISSVSGSLSRHSIKCSSGYLFYFPLLFYLSIFICFHILLFSYSLKFSSFCNLLISGCFGQIRFNRIVLQLFLTTELNSLSHIP